MVTVMTLPSLGDNDKGWCAPPAPGTGIGTRKSLFPETLSRGKNQTGFKREYYPVQTAFGEQHQRAVNCPRTEQLIPTQFLAVFKALCTGKIRTAPCHACAPN